MPSNAAKKPVNSTDADAVEENNTVPAQATADENTNDQQADLTVLEGGKKSLKERVAAVGEQLKKNRKALVAVGAVVAAAAVAFAQYNKKQADAALVEDVADEPTEAPESVPEETKTSKKKSA